MCLWNKILLGLIAVAGIAFFYLAARTLKTHAYWRELSQKHQQALDQVAAENAALLSGAQAEGEATRVGIRELEVELHRVLSNRGRAWYNCDPKVSVNPQTGAATAVVTTDVPDPHGIADKTVIYAFEETDTRDKGRYLGEFKVTQVAERQVTIEPSTALSLRELQKLAAARKPWMLYEVLPRDGHDAFAALSDEDLKAMLPDEVEAEFLKDGKPAGADDPAELQDAQGRYRRQLRDYATLFDVVRVYRTVMQDLTAALERDVQLVQAAATSAQQGEEARRQQVAAAKTALARVEHERDAIEAHRKLLQTRIDGLAAEAARLLAANRQIVAELANIQREAARQIDARSNTMAQSARE